MFSTWEVKFGAVAAADASVNMAAETNLKYKVTPDWGDVVVDTFANLTFESANISIVCKQTVSHCPCVSKQ